MTRDSLAPRSWCLQLAIAALFLVGSLGLMSKPARADIDLRFDIGNAPRLNGYYFRGQPHRWYDSSTGVYVIDDPYLADEDAFQYGGYYWVFRDGYWYRSSRWGGDFVVVAPQYVPSAVYDVPASRWHHHPSYDSMHFSAGWRNRGAWQDRGMRDTNYRRYDNRRNRDWRDRGDSYYRYRNRDRYDRNDRTNRYDRNDRNDRYDRRNDNGQ